MCIYCAMFNCDTTPYRLKKLLPPPKPSYPVKLPGIWKPSWGSAAGAGAGVLSFWVLDAAFWPSPERLPPPLYSRLSRITQGILRFSLVSSSSQTSSSYRPLRLIKEPSFRPILRMRSTRAGSKLLMHLCRNALPRLYESFGVLRCGIVTYVSGNDQCRYVRRCYAGYRSDITAH